MKRQYGYTAVEILLAAIVMLGFGGWIANIAKLIAMNMDHTGMLIARVVGIFVAPLGAVLGFF